MEKLGLLLDRPSPTQGVPVQEVEQGSTLTGYHFSLLLVNLSKADGQAGLLLQGLVPCPTGNCV